MRKSLRCPAFILLLLATSSCAMGDAIRGRDRTDEHDMSALMRAAAAGDSAEVERLTAAGANIDQTVRDHSGFRYMMAFLAFMQDLPNRDEDYAAFHYALANRHLGIARALIAHGAAVHTYAGKWSLAYTSNGQAGLELLLGAGLRPDSTDGAVTVVIAVRARDTTALIRLLRAGADPDAPGAPGGTPLMNAARSADSASVRILLAAGASRTAQDPDTKWTAAMIARDAGHVAVADMIGGPENRGALRNEELHRAIVSRDTAAVLRLLAEGASARALSVTGGHPMIATAMIVGDHRIIAALIEARADVNATDIGGPMIISAIQTRDSVIVAMLMEAGANVRVPAAATTAASMGSAAVLRMVADAGADVRESNDEPLRAAALQGHAEVVKYLIARGANVNAADREGRTPLGGATAGRNLEVARLLLDAGARTDPPDKTWTPLMSAAMGGDTAMVTLLLSRGANPKALSSEGRTPAEIARRAGQDALARRLDAIR